MDVLVSSKLESINFIILDDVLFGVFAATENILERVSERYEFVVSCTAMSEEQVTIRILRHYLSSTIGSELS